MRKKLAIAGTLVLLIALTVSLGSASMASAASRPKALSYRVIKHTSRYDVVRGHQRTLLEVALDLPAERRVAADVVAEEIARRKVQESHSLRQACGLGALAGSRTTDHDVDPHLMNPS